MVFMGQVTPLMRTPFTDALTAGSFMVPLKEREFDFCSSFRMRLFECMEAYGRNLTHVKCQDLYTDLQECTYGSKQYQRIVHMRRERDRQFKAGERKEHYSETPVFDAY